MKRIILYILILGGLFFAPVESAEVANLEPVQAVWMYQNNGKIILETDTEDRGMGTTVDEALADMKKQSSGIIYLDTAQYLFVTETQGQIADMEPHLKGSVRLCQWSGRGNLQDAVKYADAHEIGSKIQDWKPNVILPNLAI